MMTRSYWFDFKLYFLACVYNDNNLQPEENRSL